VANDAIQRIKQLDAERSKLLETAKKEALDRANQAVADLVALGFAYSLVEGTAKGPRRARAKKAMRRKKDVECPVCKFKTSPPHDARTHRSQGKRKRPFNAKQLSEMGLKKVA
jgi:hypothetical protein